MGHGKDTAPDDSIFRLAEGLQRAYGEEASLLIRQFAAENEKVGDLFSAAFWNGVANVISASKTLLSLGERAR